MRGVHSFGQELRTCVLPGIHVAETLMPAGLVLPEHAHDPGQVCFILEGTYSEELAGGEHLLRPGDIQFHSPGERHANSVAAGGALTLLISVDRERWIDVVARRPFCSPVLDEIGREVRKELARQDPASSAALEGLSLVLLSRLARLELQGGAREPQWVREAVFRIERDYDRPMSLSSVAEDAGVHRATLAAAFRRFRGTSVGELIRSVRIARAREALAGTNAPIAEVAQQTGFADQAHLGRVFKRMTGMTPGDFRRRGG
ncbi:MAG TPA: AraC family transcriptional regulator [Thermoanaerobaculia bacterium]|nr:AraC family transcriptional regulator [Thermoanaerobaculia bacterium]